MFVNYETIMGKYTINPLLSLRNGEGTGDPLQYSCLENPMGGGAWWAAAHGVAGRVRHD